MTVNTARTDIVSRKQRDNDEMSDRQVTGFLGRKIYQAMNDEDGDLSDTRQDLFNRYYGELYGTERSGYSTFTTREVLEAVEWALPSLLRVFLGSDRAVAFDAVGPDDEAAAAQETDVVNYKILKANGGDGFIAIHDFIKDALLFPNSYIKVYIEEEERTMVHTVKDVPAEGLAMLMEDEDIEILEQDSRFIKVETPVAPNPEDPDGEPIMRPQKIEVFELRYRKTTQKRTLKLMSVPGEEALVDNDLTTLNLDHGDFVCHRVRKAYSELIREGFDPDELDDVGTYEDYQWNDERTNRLFYEDEDPDAEDEDDPSMRRFWVHECYAWFDYDGSGQAQYRRVVLIGAKIFENEETDYQPLVAMSSILVPHKHNGLSIAQLVEDLQELITTLTRQLLDNIYKINVRRKIISEDSLLEDGSTMEAMLNIQAEWIPVQGAAQNAIFPETTPTIVNEILPVIQDARVATSLRSGIAPENNLDPDVLQQSTEGAFMGAMEKAGERLEMLARIMAETGFKQLFRKVHQLHRSHPDIATAVKLRGEWVDVDPSSWQERTDISVNVGLGFNSKRQMVGLLTQMLEVQKEGMASGSGLVDIEKIYNTLHKLTEATGVGSTDQFFNDPGDPNFQPPEPPPPDPAAILAQAQADALGKEQERKGMESQAKVQLDGQKLQQDGQKNFAEIQVKQADSALKSEELILRRREADLKERELDLREIEVEAGVMNTNADTELKGAQTLKTTADAGGSIAGKEKTQAETVEIARNDSDEGSDDDAEDDENTK